MTEVERLKRIAIDLKVDLNIRDAKIRKLERQLAEARQPAPGTQTMEKLQILCENEEDNGQDPMDSGQYRNPLGEWNNE